MDAPAGSLSFETAAAGELGVRLAGDWRTRGHLPPRDEVEQRIDAGGVRSLKLEGSALGDWDTGLLTFVVGLIHRCEERKIEVDTSGLPDGVQQLLRLTFAVPEKTDTGKGGARAGFLARVGDRATAAAAEVSAGVEFLGSAVQALGLFFTGRAQYRRSDLALFTQEAGAQALGIVSLISFLVGLILGFVGAQQLAIFGAEIYTANLVAIAMAREMAPIMAGIIMAGRTGAAYAAQLGTMTVNEETDAFQTMGFSPMQFLVLPRMLALILMMPLLCLYADLLGIAGGALVATALYDINPQLYYEQTVDSLALKHVWIGVGKASIFGILVALAGCMRGMNSGRSASAVGEAATSAVVTGIILIIVTDAIFAVMLSVVGI